MNTPTKTLEKLVLGGDLEWDGNPIVPWMFSNVTITMDAAGNQKCDKAKSANKIDGVVALVEALGQYMIDAADPDNIWADTLATWIENDKVMACRTAISVEEFRRGLVGYEFVS